MMREALLVKRGLSSQLHQKRFRTNLKRAEKLQIGSSDQNKLRFRSSPFNELWSVRSREIWFCREVGDIETSDSLIAGSARIAFI